MSIQRSVGAAVLVATMGIGLFAQGKPAEGSIPLTIESVGPQRTRLTVNVNPDALIFEGAKFTVTQDANGTTIQSSAPTTMTTVGSKDSSIFPIGINLTIRANGVIQGRTPTLPAR